MTKRIALVLLLLAAFGAYLTAWGPPAVAQLPIGSVRIMDGVHNQLARVNHTGQLAVDASVSVTVDTIAHQSSVVHVAAAGGGLVIRDPINPNARARVDHTGALVTSATVSVTTDTVNVFHQSTIRHISGAIHVAGTIRGAAFHVQGLGVPGQAHGGVLSIQGVAGGVAVPVSLTSGGDAVNVFHQSTVRHISSVTHVSILQGSAGGASHLLVAPVYQAGTWTVQPGNTANTTAWLTRNVAGQSGTWTIQAAHQGGQWNIAHITGAVHLAGNVTDQNNNALRVTGVTVFTVMGAIDHITSALHVAGTVNGARFHIQGVGSPGASHGGVMSIQGVTGMNPVASSQSGAWNVSAAQSGSLTIQATHQGGEWNVRHVTSVVHMAAADGGFVIRDPINANARARVDHTGALVTSATVSVTTDNVNVFHQSTIRHISSVTHIGGFIGIRDGLCLTCWARVDHTGALVTSASVTTTVDNVNVFHQSTVRHISSVTHVAIVQGSAGGASHLLVAPIYQAGPWNVSAAQSGAWTVQAAHQGGEWNIRHVTSVVHVAILQGSPGGASHLLVAPVYQAGTWTVQPGNTANTTAWLTRNVAGQSGSWTIQAAHQGGEWNVRHVGSVVHVAIVQGASGGASHLLVAPVYQAGTWTVQPGNTANTTAWLTRNIAGQSGSWTIQAAHQGGEWNVRHVGSVTHVQGTAFLGDKADPARTVAVTHANALFVHIASFGPNNGNPTFCHSVASFVIHAGTNVAPVIHVAAGRRVAICGIVLIASVANDVSLVEGNDANGDINGNNSAYSGGCGARAGASAGAWSPLIGGSSRGMPLVANSGWSIAAGIPWLQTQTRGNSVCVVKNTGGGHVTGVISFAGFQ